MTDSTLGGNAPVFLMLLLLAGCASASVCDRTCLKEENDETLFIALKSGASITLYGGLYTVVLDGDSGTIAGIGRIAGDPAGGAPHRWQGTLNLADVASIETKHVSLPGTLIGVALFSAPFMAVMLARWIVGS